MATQEQDITVYLCPCIETEISDFDGMHACIQCALVGSCSARCPPWPHSQGESLLGPYDRNSNPHLTGEEEWLIREVGAYLRDVSVC